MEHSTYHKLVIAASDLLRQHGYAATGISDILRCADVTRGSLYHHFPRGKSDLAIAASYHSADSLLEHIEKACERAISAGGDYSDAMVEFSKIIYELFESRPKWRFMTVSATLLDGGERNEIFYREARLLYEKLRLKAIEQGARFGLSAEESYLPLRKTMILLEGSWLQARVLNDSMPMISVIKFVQEDKLVNAMRGELNLQHIASIKPL
nr:helix-turn-helix domain-containing protein [uncultured Cohaesibacter sp.]